MELSYDLQGNVAYIQLRRKKGKVKTVAVSDDLNVDVAADGTIYGIELLNANAQLLEGKGMVLKNVATGRSQMLNMP
jgi:uncharacterized protein YuzE